MMAMAMTTVTRTSTSQLSATEPLYRALALTLISAVKVSDPLPYFLSFARGRLLT